MKRIFTLFLSFILILSLAGCNKRTMDYIIKNEPSITGIVKDTGTTSILIENESGEYSVSLAVENKDSMTDFNIGDEVTVYYDGSVAETYPMQIIKVYAITLKNPAAEKSENTETSEAENEAATTETAGESNSSPAEPATEPTADHEVSGQEGAVKVSNLFDEERKALLKELLTNAGISDARIEAFFAHVEQFNSIEGMENKIAKTETIPYADSNFDEYDLQDTWTAAYPDFNGYDCRITAFSLMADFIKAADTENPDTRNIFMDLDSLDQDKSAVSGDGDLEKFAALFSTVEGDNSDNQEKQIELVKAAWESRGIEIKREEKGTAGEAAFGTGPSEATPALSLINLYLHAHYEDTDNEVFVGHAGILIDCGEDGLYFLEKLAFQAPYRFIKLESRDQLKQYLLTRYASYTNEGEAPAFVMENDEVL